jgi:hypothetical protein
MKTYPAEAQKAVDEAQEQAAVGLHRLVRPFERENTTAWRDRERIRNALEDVRNNADEACLCLEVGEKLQDSLPQASQAMRDLDAAISELNARPKVVCLCGSTRFWKTFQEINLRETCAGNIVLSIGAATRSDTEHLASGAITAEDKQRFDELHKRKIDLADEILVLNVGGYVGDSTRSEIAYATLTGKPVRWLETLMA